MRFRSKPPTPEERRARERERAKRAALRALKMARKAAEASRTKLSDWEGEFLGSVEDRVQTYGRAFRDPEKGSPGASLSVRQGAKLKEIAAKANGKATRPKRPFGG